MSIRASSVSVSIVILTWPFFHSAMFLTSSPFKEWVNCDRLMILTFPSRIDPVICYLNALFIFFKSCVQEKLDELMEEPMESEEI